MSVDADSRHAAKYGQVAGRIRRGSTALAMRCAFRRGGRAHWAMRDGVVLLYRWLGDRNPLPTLSPGPTRGEQLVGTALPGDTQVKAFADVAHLLNRIYWYGPVTCNGAGVLRAMSRVQVVPRATDASGDPAALMPNAPSCVEVRRGAGNVPIVSWIYSGFGEQVRPAYFRIYAAGAGSFNFASPAASVAYTLNRTRYSWTGTALSEGDVRYYTVRAEAADGTLSPIPQAGVSVSPIYTQVSKGRVAALEIPTGPVASPDGLVAEPVL